MWKSRSYSCPGNSSHFPTVLYSSGEFGKEDHSANKKFLDDDALGGKADGRVSLKVSETLYREFEDILERTDLSKTDFIKPLILFATHEILNEKSKDRINRVKEVLLSAA